MRPKFLVQDSLGIYIYTTYHISHLEASIHFISVLSQKVWQLVVGPPESIFITPHGRIRRAFWTCHRWNHCAVQVQYFFWFSWMSIFMSLIIQITLPETSIFRGYVSCREYIDREPGTFKETDWKRAALDRCRRPYLNDEDLLPGPHVAFEVCGLPCHERLLGPLVGSRNTCSGKSWASARISSESVSNCFDFLMFLSWQL